MPARRGNGGLLQRNRCGYVAWADVDQEQLELTPKISVMTTWDARWLMLISLIIITLIMAWLMEEKRPKKRSSPKEK